MTTTAKTEQAVETPAGKQPAKRGLGRGLSALIPQAASLAASTPAASAVGDTQSAGYRALPLRAISLNPNQPRKAFSKAEMEELESSIREHGVLQPIVVRPKSHAGHAGGRGETFELVAGERRFRAASAAGLETIPAVVREMDDQMSLAVALIENIQRENLNIVETAQGYDQLLREFHMTQTQLAQAVGKSQPQVANALRLLGLSSQILESLRIGQITEGHAKVILTVPEHDRHAMWSAIVARNLTVRDAEREAAKYRNSPVKAAAAPRQPTAADPHLDEIGRRMSLNIGTKVRLVPGKGSRGTIEIAYYDQDQLEDLIERFGGN